MENRWVIMENEDRDSTFTHAVLDLGKKGTHRVRFATRSAQDAHFLIEALGFMEAMSYGFMPAVVIDQGPQQTGPKRRQSRPRGKAPRKS